jgi:branched-chain amino acid transport system substrate-binding protein
MSLKALFLSAVAAACLPVMARADEPGITPTSIKIGMFAPLSGPNVAYGQDVLNAAKMWYEKINKEGGINGRKIETVVEDDRCNPNDVVAAVKKLVEQDQVFMLNGGSCSAATVAASDYVQRNKIPFVMLNASGDGALFPPQRYIFGALSISQHAAGGSMVKFAVEQLHAKKIGYINHDDAYGAWNLVAAKFQAEKMGATLAVESLSPTISDVTATMLKVRAANPDVILVMTYARPAALVVRKAYELGMKMPMVLSVNGIADLQQMAENVGGPPAFTNFYTQEVLQDPPGSPSLQWVYDLFKASYPDLAGQPGRPQVYMPYGLPPAMVVVNALKAAGPNPTREAVADALAHENFDSHVMAAPIVFTPTNHAGQSGAIYQKFDGKTLTRVPGVFSSDWQPTE